MAIINGEPERDKFLEIIAGSDRRMISSVTLIELRFVIFARLGAPGIERLSTLLQANEAEVVPFDEVQADAAFAAFKTFGKGINPKSRLNLGDCASYALAKTRRVPLLYKGDDFAATDIEAADAHDPSSPPAT